MEKRKYLAPGVEALPFGAELMQEVIVTSPTPADPDGKATDDVVNDDEEIAAPVKDVWSDEEKKIVK